MNELNEKKMLEQEAFMVLHKHLKVEFLHKGDELGHTSGIDRTIHIAWDHEYFKGYSEPETIYFRKGVFAHELLHQCYTNFSYDMKLMNSLKSQVEKKVYRIISNILEDPAIEFFADRALGDNLVDALRFSIREIYKKSPEISDTRDAFGQYVNALIQFGDMGIVKGSFTFDNAREIFKKTVPLFYKGIHTFNNKKRLDIAMECMEMSRPLWKDAYRNEQELMEALQRLLEQLEKSGGKTERGSGSDCGISIQDDSNVNGSDSGGQGSGSGNISDPVPGREEAARSFGSGNPDEALNNIKKSKEDADKEADNKIQPDKSKMEQNAQRVNAPRRNSKNDFSISEKVSSKMGIKNHTVSIDSASSMRYRNLKQSLNSDINYLNKAMKTLFDEDMDEYIHHTSGKYDVVRGSVGKTVKIFNKKRVPAECSDMAVLLAVDNSGSMHGERIKNAVCAAIVIAEAFEKLNVPVYIMGFTFDVEQFVPWKHSKDQLSAIAKMEANGGTNDSTAVRFAREILKQQNSTHKFLFMLSDGYGDSGLKEEVKKTRQIADVFAIGLGDIDVNYFKDVYGQDFLHMDNPTGLSKKLSQKIIKLTKELESRIR